MRAAFLAGVAALALLLLAQVPAFAADWKLVAAETTIAGVSGPSGAVALSETRWLLERPPGGPYDRIQVHRYRRSEERSRHGSDAAPARAALLYLPGTHMNGALSLSDVRHDLWLGLALRGIEVWTLDYRTHFVPASSSAENGGHAFMQDWTLERFVDDARAAAALVRRESGVPALFVAGFSRGATLAFGVACMESQGAVAGLVVLDGHFKSAASAAPAAPLDFEAERQRLFAEGRYSTDVAGRIGWEKRHQLMTAAADDPSGPALDPGFASVGEQVASILYGAWRPGALADPVNGVSRVDVLARLLVGYDRYWPAIQNLEGRGVSLLADDPRTPIDDAWGELTLPILYFGATNLGAEWILDGVFSVTKSGSPDVELHVLEGFGHLDVLVGERSAELVQAPIARWIEAHASLVAAAGPE
jgi:hypothetical protein